MNRLIQDLLDGAVMEAGRLAIERARLSASGLIVEAVDMQRSLASSSSLELRSDVDSDVPEVWGDWDRLLQVFENPTGNAIKFTTAGGCITVGATSRDHEVIFRVADTGSVITPQNLPRVFDRFWQATGAGRQGAGLGLPITKGIVEPHGGRVWVESTPNRGTTFSFTIPEATPEQGRPSGPGGARIWKVTEPLRSDAGFSGGSCSFRCILVQLGSGRENAKARHIRRCALVHSRAFVSNGF